MTQSFADLVDSSIQTRYNVRVTDNLHNLPPQNPANPNGATASYRHCCVRFLGPVLALSRDAPHASPSVAS